VSAERAAPFRVQPASTPQPHTLYTRLTNLYREAHPSHTKTPKLTACVRVKYFECVFCSSWSYSADLSCVRCSAHCGQCQAQAGPPRPPAAQPRAHSMELLSTRVRPLAPKTAFLFYYFCMYVYLFSPHKTHAIAVTPLDAVQHSLYTLPLKPIYLFAPILCYFIMMMLAVKSEMLSIFVELFILMDLQCCITINVVLRQGRGKFSQS
jgi:hypothetical protein